MILPELKIVFWKKIEIQRSCRLVIIQTFHLNVSKRFLIIYGEENRWIVSPCPTTASTSCILFKIWQIKAESSRVVVETIFRTQIFLIRQHPT